ncbi:MAG: type II toxin-antitoxin system RelE/ParE family toxin [Rubrivivax sp.]
MISDAGNSPEWEVEFHDDFDPEFDALSADVQDELLATAKAVQRLGPEASRPHVGTLGNARHPNMKELRFTANNGAEVWRAAFAFDPRRKAIVLVAADKQGKDEKKFYRDLLRVANRRFDDHLKKLEAGSRPPRRKQR